MTPNYYSSPQSQSILGDLTNNMSYSVSAMAENSSLPVPPPEVKTEQKVSAFAPLITNLPTTPQSVFWTAYQKSLLELQQQKPIQLTTTTPLDLTRSKWYVFFF